VALGALHPPPLQRSEERAAFSRLRQRTPLLGATTRAALSATAVGKARVRALAEKLGEVGKRAGGSGAKEGLKKEYVAKVEELLKEMSSLMEEAKSVAEHLLGLYRELERRLETIKLDEQVREVDRSVERAALQERMQEVVKELEAVRRWVLGAPADPTKLEQLKKRLSELEAERELLEVRLLIEGRRDLQEALDRLAREIAQLRVEVERASIESKPVDAIADSARVLRERGLLPDHLHSATKSIRDND